MHDRRLVAQHLHLDVPHARQEFLDVERAVAERRLRLRLRLRERVAHRRSVGDEPHPATAAARRRLEDQRKADGFRNARRLLPVADHTLRAGSGAQTRFRGGCARGRLVAHQPDHIGAGTDPGQSLRHAERGEIGVLRQEAVAGMDRIRLERLGCLHEQRLVQIALRRARRADADGAIGELHRERVAVSLRINLDGLDPQVAARAIDAHGDFAAVGDQHASNRLRHARLAVRRSIRT